MANNLILLWLAALPLMGSPGPATMSLAAMGAAYGARRSVSYLAGIILGTFCVLILIATGITGLVLAEPAIAAAISLAAAGYILYLAYRIATAPVLDEDKTKSKPPSIRSGFFLAIANPKAFAAIGAVYTGHRLLQHSLWLDAGAKIAALTFVLVVVNCGWLIFGSALSSVLRNPKSGRIANIIFAIMLVASVGLAFFGG